jgi:hypothetical protein
MRELPYRHQRSVCVSSSNLSRGAAGRIALHGGNEIVRRRIEVWRHLDHVLEQAEGRRCARARARRHDTRSPGRGTHEAWRRGVPVAAGLEASIGTRGCLRWCPWSWHARLPVVTRCAHIDPDDIKAEPRSTAAARRRNGTRLPCPLSEPARARLPARSAGTRPADRHGTRPCRRRGREPARPPR